MSDAVRRLRDIDENWPSEDAARMAHKALPLLLDIAEAAEWAADADEGLAAALAAFNAAFAERSTDE